MNLVGKWGSTDGMTYSFGQVENKVYIYGSGNGSSNVATGYINGEFLIAEWGDVDGSAGIGNSGSFVSKIISDVRIEKVAGDSGFGMGSFIKK